MYLTALSLITQLSALLKYFWTHLKCCKSNFELSFSTWLRCFYQPEVCLVEKQEGLGPGSFHSWGGGPNWPDHVQAKKHCRTSLKTGRRVKVSWKFTPPEKQEQRNGGNRTAGPAFSSSCASRIRCGRISVQQVSWGPSLDLSLSYLPQPIRYVMGRQVSTTTIKVNGPLYRQWRCPLSDSHQLQKHSSRTHQSVCVTWLAGGPRRVHKVGQ